MRRVGDDAGNVCEDLLGIAMTDAGYGWATASMAVPEGVSVDDPLPPELLGTLADVAVGRSVLTTIPSPGGCRTAQLHVDVTGVPVTAGQTLAVRGLLVHRDEDLGISTAEITDASGATLARASGWLAMVPSAEHAVPSQADRLRPQRADLAELRRLVAWQSTGRSGDRVVRTAPEMANRFHIMHGGMQLTLLTGALTARGADAIGHRPRLLSIDAVLHRPVPVDHDLVTAVSRVLRAGRRVLTVAGELVEPGGKPLITGTALFAVPPR